MLRFYVECFFFPSNYAREFVINCQAPLNIEDYAVTHLFSQVLINFATEQQEEAVLRRLKDFVLVTRLFTSFQNLKVV